MENKIDKILITGGAGFIGSHLAETMLQRGMEVIVVDNLSTGKMENIEHLLVYKGFRFYKEDIRNKSKLRAIFSSELPSIVSHHAAQKSVPKSVEDPKIDFDINLVGLINVLDCIIEYDVRNVIYVSSGGALSKEIMYNEKSKEIDFPQLLSPYALSKFAGEKYVAFYSKRYGFDFSILRYANVYGPRQVPEGESGVIPIFINNILEEKPSIIMTFTDMPNGCTRDYIFVSDAITANVLAIANPTNCVVNIASGQEVSVREIYDCIENVFDIKIPISTAGPRNGDIRRSVLDASLAESLLGWIPKVSLEQGIITLKEFLEQNRAGHCELVHEVFDNESYGY
jgi:UDP-glucose 4-epimerase